MGPDGRSPEVAHFTITCPTMAGMPNLIQGNHLHYFLELRAKHVKANLTASLMSYFGEFSYTI